MSYTYLELPLFSLDDFHNFAHSLSQSNNNAGSQRQVQRSGQSGNGHEHHPNQAARAFQPRMDIHESQDSNLITATLELPGMNKQDVNIDVRDGRLIVSGETAHAKEVNEAGYIMRERYSGKFSRSLPLPAGTQVSKSLLCRVHSFGS